MKLVRQTDGRQINVGMLAGVAGFLIPTVGNFLLPIWRMPATSASGSQVARYVIEHQDALRGVAVLDTVGVTLWTVFGCAIWLRLRRAAGADTLATSLFGGAFGAMILLLMSGFTIVFVLAYRAPDATTARVLYDVTFAFLAMSGMPTVIALTAYAAIALTDPHMSRSTGQLAGLTAAAHLLLLASLVTPSGVLSLEGPLITLMPALLFTWIFTTALTLRRPDPTATRARQVVAASG